MTEESAKQVPGPWDAALVRAWLERRIVAARADQAVAQRGGRKEEDDCDKASAEELVCRHVLLRDIADTQAGFAAALKDLLARDSYHGRGIYDDTRFERHVRSYIRKLAKMAKANQGFENKLRYQR